MLSTQNNKWDLQFGLPLKFSLGAAHASGTHFCGMNAAPAGSRINPQRGHQA
jgi:hypothetical protein